LIIVDSPIEGCLAFVVSRVWVDCLKPQKSAGDVFAAILSGIGKGCAPNVVSSIGIEALIEKIVDGLETPRVTRVVQEGAAFRVKLVEVDSSGFRNDPENSRLVVDDSPVQIRPIAYPTVRISIVSKREQ
jgi:hypothetical protein